MMTTTNTVTVATVTTEQIHDLLAEAFAAGDDAMVRTCDLAMAGSKRAKAAVCKAINAARAMAD